MAKGLLSHDLIIQYSVRMFLPTSRVLNFCDKCSKYIGNLGTRLPRTISLANISESILYVTNPALDGRRDWHLRTTVDV